MSSKLAFDDVHGSEMIRESERGEADLREEK